MQEPSVDEETADLETTLGILEWVRAVSVWLKETEKKARVEPDVNL